MSTGSDLSVYFENSPLGRRYTIHLKSKDEICLHALTLLQAGSLPCFLPVVFNEEDSELLIDLNGCIPISDIHGKDKTFVMRNHRALLSDFLHALISSPDHAMDPSGICYLEDQLFYDRNNQKLVCVYLPLTARLKSGPYLSGIDESGLDDLLHFAYEHNWISSKAMEHLYEYFRKDDDASALSFIHQGLWEESRTLPSRIRFLLFIWLVLLFLDILFSPKIKKALSGSLFSSFPDTVFFLCTAVLAVVLFLQIRNASKDKKQYAEKKVRRRKNRNTKILFPSSDIMSNENDPLGLHPDPVQLIRIDDQSSKSKEKTRFTIWTNTCTVGCDSDCCSLPIDHPSLALKHAVFGHDEYGFYIEALQENKGTYKNRQRIRSELRSYLEEGDIVGIGELEFEVHFIHSTKENQSSE